LGNVKLQVEKDRQEKPAQIGTIEQIFQFVLNGRIQIDSEMMEYLKNNYQINEEQPFVILCVYLGSHYEEVWESMKEYFQHAFSRYPTLSYSIVESTYRDSLIGILYHYENAHDLERWMQYQILHYSKEKISAGWVEVHGIYEVKEGFEQLYPYMDWNISLNQEILISYPKITNIQTVSCIYPIELETKMKVAVCAYDWEKVTELMEKFHKNFQDGRVYLPKEIKECYVRFLWAIIAVAKEIGCLDKKELEQQKLLGMIMNARIREELLEASEFLLRNIYQKNTEADAVHLTVKRVKSMIHEFYQSGITLDEIGAKLDITPEYLGTLFHREMGVTFSTYVKNFRIGKAKELLCGTQLKLYEIAERVGYSDSKYFSKVFKEVTGQLPTEYRKTYK
jgi:two-component system response regulator YesN